MRPADRVGQGGRIEFIARVRHLGARGRRGDPSRRQEARVGLHADEIGMVARDIDPVAVKPVGDKSSANDGPPGA